MKDRKSNLATFSFQVTNKTFSIPLSGVHLLQGSLHPRFQKQPDPGFVKFLWRFHCDRNVIDRGVTLALFCRELDVGEHFEEILFKPNHIGEAIKQSKTYDNAQRSLHALLTQLRDARTRAHRESSASIKRYAMTK